MLADTLQMCSAQPESERSDRFTRTPNKEFTQFLSGLGTLSLLQGQPETPQDTLPLRGFAPVFANINSQTVFISPSLCTSSATR